MEQITELINDVMVKVKNLYEQKRRELTVSLLAQCLRMSYYYVTRGKDVTEKMVAGSEHHAFFQRHFTELLQERGFICWEEYEVRYWQLRGRADLFCVDKDGLGIIFEYKFTTLPYKNNPFYPFWYRQLRYYVALEKTSSGRETVGVLIASSFTLDKWIIDIVKVDDPLEVVREMDRRYQELSEALDRNEPPLPERGKWCEYCSVRQVCLNQQLV
jgi:CRISPR/Cas system-associated exonuclease Cas4 (RecB family)